MVEDYRKTGGNSGGGSGGGDGGMSSLRFSIELRPGETTIVSWKKLVNNINKSSTPKTSITAAPDQPTEADLKDAPAPSRFSAVIEKIERLYVGNQSSDGEDLGDVPDDDQYDTEDSFIDDADLDEYFQVDKSTTKHNGFFVNRGKLESSNELSSPKPPPRKRRRDGMKTYTEMDVEHLCNRHAKMVNMRMKAAARTAPLLGGDSSVPFQILVSESEHYHHENCLNQSSGPIGPSTNKPADLNVKMEHYLSSKLSRDTSISPLESTGRERLLTGAIQSRDVDNALKVAGESSDYSHQMYQNKGTSTETDLQSSRPLRDSNEMEVSTKVWKMERHGGCELPDLNFPQSENLVKTTKTSTHAKEGSSVRSKGSILERAIRDVEKLVVESKPQTMDVLVTDSSSQAVKRRLPREVKQKLAKVARLASSQGKISEEVINRLMSILGHMVQRKTLKRNLKEMVELGLSAKKEKDRKFQFIKKEVVEMIKMRAPSLKAKVQRDGASGEFQEACGSEEKGIPKVRYTMDNTMEDKICDLYDLYVEGMDENKGPQIRKLYVELAELWPGGTMDNHGIKNAICRSKARKRAMYSRLKGKIKQRNLSSTPRSEEVVQGEGGSSTQPQHVQHRIAMDSGTRVVSSLNQMTPNTTSQYLETSDRMSHSSISGNSLNLPANEKIKGSSTVYVDEVKKTTDHAHLKKKVQRKLESDLYFNPERLSSQQGKERQKSHKQVSNDPHKSSLELGGLPGPDQFY